MVTSKDPLKLADSSETGLILGIETSILTGSLAIWDGNDLTSSRDSVVSRSETLLPAIADLCRDSGRDIRDISSVVVSLGPGSFTGIRIGIATAIGLESALGVRCIGISTFDAVEPPERIRSGIVVIPLGRDQFGLRYYELQKSELDIAHAINILNCDELATLIASKGDLDFYFPLESRTGLNVELFANHSNVVFSGTSTAAQLCILAAEGRGTLELEPLYIRREN